jgi:K+-transporting ATPase ATPase A chain
MRWTEYAVAMLLFSAASMLLLYLMQRVQGHLPFNPQKFAGVAPQHLAFNTAASFTTNTNWQVYSGENTMSYFTQMAGLAYHNFVSAATGIALAIAFIRGIGRRQMQTIGNFWVDLVRGSLWVLMPFCIVGALLLVSTGVVQNLRPYDTVKIVEPQQVPKLDAAGKPVLGANGKPVMDTITEQTIAQGPVASQEIIKEFGTNGGGFFNANSAHPFENPSPISNLIEMFSIFAISAGLTYTLGRMTGSQRHGWAVWGAMAVLFLAGVTTAYWAESHGNPLLKGVDQHVSALQSGGNMEGKEVRFGIANTAFFATITTDASCGAIIGWHDSFTPLGGMVPLVNIMLSEVIFGGVGAGMYGILIYVVLAVFIAGLMVGRTPEYLGKKIEAYDVKMAMLVALVFPLIILTFTAISAVKPYGLAGISNPGPHGLHFRRGQQRFGFRRIDGQHSVVRHDHRLDDADRALLHDYPDAGNRRKPGAKKIYSAVAGHVSRNDAVIQRAADRHHPDPGCAYVFSGAQSRSHPRTAADAGRKGLLIHVQQYTPPFALGRENHAPCCVGRGTEARPAQDDGESRHVRGGSGERGHYCPAHPQSAR